MKIYLAGPVFQCEDQECVFWRRDVKRRLSDFVVVDPMETTDFRGKTDEHYREIVELDKARIDSSDILLVNCTRPSTGTSMEILYAWERGKQVYIVCRDHQVNPWLLYHAERVFLSVDEAVSYLRSRFPAPQTN
jgi:nucleoside 2-deoxyribosyltransferase